MIAAALLLALTAAQPAPSGNLCAMCHSEVRVQFERSIHHSEEVTCVSCHGGDPNASTVPAAHSGNFRGVPSRRDIPTLCASCHADGSHMRPYNLPIDQLALYQTSQHGLRLAKGDQKVAVCTDCHGAHEILKHDDPRSSVFPLNVPRTCGRCHGDEALMRGYGLSDNPLADFTAGVHGEALMTRRDAAAPECASCHGAHGAAPPAVGDVDKVCGQCHVSARASFLEGPHKDGMRKAGLPECASCHSNHRILKTDLSMLDTVCSSCHETSSPPVLMGRQMKVLYMGAHDEIEKAGQLMGQAASVPLYMQDYQARLEEARTSLKESLPAMHALDLARVDRLTHRALAIGGEIESEVRGKLEARKWRLLGLGVFWFYLILTLALLLRQRRRAGTGVA